MKEICTWIYSHRMIWQGNQTLIYLPSRGKDDVWCETGDRTAGELTVYWILYMVLGCRQDQRLRDAHAWISSAGTWPLDIIVHSRISCIPASSWRWWYLVPPWDILAHTQPCLPFSFRSSIFRSHDRVLEYRLFDKISAENLDRVLPVNYTILMYNSWRPVHVIWGDSCC